MKKNILFIISGLIIGIVLTVSATYLYKANDIQYKDSNVEEAINELYDYNKKSLVVTLSGETLNSSFGYGVIHLNPLETYGFKKFKYIEHSKNIDGQGSCIPQAWSKKLEEFETISLNKEYNISDYVNIESVAQSSNDKWLACYYNVEFIK